MLDAFEMWNRMRMLFKTHLRSQRAGRFRKTIYKIRENFSLHWSHFQKDCENLEKQIFTGTLTVKWSPMR